MEQRQLLRSARPAGTSATTWSAAALLFLLLFLATLAPGQARRPASAPRPAAVPAGTFTVVIGGEWSGAAEALVTPGGVVRIAGRVKNGRGGGANLTALPAILRDGRFGGTGTLAGQPVRIVGRVDPPDGVVVKRPRISFLVVTDGDGMTARGVGHLGDP